MIWSKPDSAADRLSGANTATEKTRVLRTGSRTPAILINGDRTDVVCRANRAKRTRRAYTSKLKIGTDERHIVDSGGTGRSEAELRARCHLPTAKSGADNASGSRSARCSAQCFWCKPDVILLDASRTISRARPHRRVIESERKRRTGRNVCLVGGDAIDVEVGDTHAACAGAHSQSRSTLRAGGTSRTGRASRTRRTV